MSDARSREALSRTILLCRQQVLGANDPSDDEIADALLATRVAIVADSANLASPACQHAVSVLTRLVTQYGASVALVLPSTPARIAEPRFPGTDLASVLGEVARDGLPGPTVSVAPTTREDDLVFVMGDTPWADAARRAWRITGDAWSGSLTPIDAPVSRWTASWPIGALAAASMASAEPFRLAMLRLAQQLARPLALPEQLVSTESARVVLGDGAAPEAIDLGAIDAVSGGAIIQAALDVLLRLPHGSARIRVVENETVELANMNRYQISRMRDLGKAKILGIEDAARPTALSTTGIRERLDETTLSALLPLRDQVLVGADNLQARWLAQRHAPSWLGVGATADFLAMASDHAHETACAGCAHPFDDGVRLTIPTISFVSYWGGLLLASALIGHRLGRPAGIVSEVNALRVDSPTGIRRYRLRANPRCPIRCEASQVRG